MAKVLDLTWLDELEDIAPVGSKALTEDAAPPVLTLEESTMETLVPVDEQGITTPEDDTDAYTEAVRCGCFSPVSGMVRIDSALLGGPLYACVQMDSKGNRTVVFRQQYGDGRFSSQICIEQSDLLMYAIATESKDRSLKTRAKAILMKVYKDYFGKFDGDVAIDAAVILRVLFSVVGQLPVEHDSVDVLDNPSLLYSEIVNLIKGNDPHFSMPYGLCVERTAYYGLVEEQLDALAGHFGVKRQTLLKKLNEYNLLYLTPSSRGYQTKVRFPAEDDFPSHAEWQYCIFKCEYFTSQKQLEEPNNP